jgi:hypothetical protein
MKPQPDKITFKEFLNELRPDLSPSLASKEFHKFFSYHLAELERWTNPKTNGLTVERIRDLPITEIISEAEIEARVCQAEEFYRKNSCGIGMVEDLKSKYTEWRRAETSRRRAEAARKKAAKVAAAKAATKAETERIKSEKKLARKKRPHFTKLADAEKELERKSFNDYLAQ